MFSHGMYRFTVILFSQDKDADGKPTKKPRKQNRVKMEAEEGISAAQMKVNEQMRKALEEDQYSANGSIVDTDSEDEEAQFMYKGQSVRLDRATLIQAARKHLWLERHGASAAGGKLAAAADGEDAANRGNAARASTKKKKKGKRGDKDDRSISPKPDTDVATSTTPSSSGDAEMERDEGSIFGQTAGSSNSTWVECDKCKKVRQASPEFPIYFSILILMNLSHLPSSGVDSGVWLTNVNYLPNGIVP